MATKDNLKLDTEDRMIIQACLHDHMNITEIAKRVRKNKSTISRELRRNAIIKQGVGSNCQQLKNLTVCNLCCKKAICQRTKHYYDFQQAAKLSDNRRKSSRSQPKLSQEAIQTIDAIITDGILLGQSLHHIYYSDSVLKSICSERTIRRLIYRGNLSVRPHQLRRYTRFKHSSVPLPKLMLLRDIRMLVGRSFKDYLRYTANHPKESCVQYDSVIGQITDRQAILTLTIPQFNFQFGRLIQKGIPSSVNRQVRMIFDCLSSAMANLIFAVNLCDNGSEFSIFYTLEFDQQGEQVRRCFYTNPYRATDKAQCERNHELVRYILPKGKSLDSLTQAQVDEMFSHINSYIRESKGNQTPYELVKKKFGQTFLEAIRIHKIPNKKVKLLPIV